MDEERSRRRAQWMAQAQRGDREAYRAVLDDVAPMLLAFLRRRVGDSDEVEDVYQDTLLALHSARHTYDSTRPLEPWLLAIARHVAADHGRRRRTRVLPVDTMPEAAGEPLERAAGRFREALGQVPAAQRQAFEMLKLEGLSVEAAAARAGTTPGALKVRAHRAYKLLRELLRG